MAGEALWTMWCCTSSEMEAMIRVGEAPMNASRVATGYAFATPEEVFAQIGAGIVVAEVVHAGADTDGCPLMRPTGRYVTYPRENGS